MTMLAKGQDAGSAEWYADVPRSIRRYVVLGLLLIVFIFGGFLTWGATAPLAAAVIAPGSFVATGRNKIIQHLEGGIIQAILVREGDKVRKGQELVKLDETAARANTRQLLLRWLRLEATQSRLQAEARGEANYVTPPALADRLADPEIKAINDGQRENFRSARAKLRNELQVLQENITALEFQKDGLLGQVAALERQKKLLRSEVEAKDALARKGILARSTVNTLERAVADADGDLARLHSDISVAEAQIDRYGKQIEQTRDTAQQAALDEMQSVDAELDAVREEIRGAQDVLERTSIKAPVDGTVIRMYYHTPGGVIESGKPIMELLPADVPLIIEAQIPRLQIDEVHENQAAAVRLTALNQRTTPTLEGRVIYISADSIAETEGAWSDEVYLARVSIPADQIARVHGFTPTPGMPAEIFIQTHERTFFEYLTKPIADSMARAFKEY
jgi:HlyD family secretion protein